MQISVTADGALSMVNVVEPSDRSWLASPAYSADAVAVPAFVLPANVTVGLADRPPAPVVLAVHAGVIGEPV